MSVRAGMDQPVGSAAVTDQQAIELLHGLVSIPSLSGREGPASEFLAGWMNSHGFAASVDASGSAVGILAGAEPPAGEPWRDIVLLGHIDTVPGEIPVRIEDGTLWGRGSVDAKGSLATFAAATAGMDVPPGVRVVVVGATEEEAASSRGARLCAQTFRPRACIIGEPSGAGAVTIGYKGRLIARAMISTPSSHSAGPEPTAGELACEGWNTVRTLAEVIETTGDVAGSAGAPTARGVFDRVQARLRSINTRSDGLHDLAEMQLGFRLPPGIHPRDLEAKIREALPHAQLAFDGHEIAYCGDARSWLVGAFNEALRARGLRPRLLKKTGTSDMNVVAASWDCPIVAYGPGDSSLDHTPGERLELSEYLAAISTLREALHTIAAHVAGEPSLRT